MSAIRPAFPARIAATALLLGLSLAACGDTPTQNSNGGGGPGTPGQPPRDTATVAAVLVSPDTMTLLGMGGHRKADATALNRYGHVLQGRRIAWTSSDATVARVDESGNVTALNPGRAWITATVDGQSSRARVDVLPLTVDSIALGQRRLEVQWGTTRWLGATTYAADGRVLEERPIAWSTSDSAVATVDALGRVTGIRGGTAWITATSEGRTARAEVIVPDVKVMTLGAAGGAALPALVMDSTYDEGEGRRRRVRVMAVEGRLAQRSSDSLYSQTVTLHRYVRLGTCVEWGSCIWEPAETMNVQVVSDRGQIRRNPHTGEPVFASSVVKDWVYYAQNAGNDAFTVYQVLPGTNRYLGWLYRL